MAKVLETHSPAHKCYGFDCWKGLPQVTEEDENMLHVGQLSSEKPNITLENVVLVEGLIEETVSQFPDMKFSFCWVDLDIYSTTKFVCEWLESHLNPGAIVGFHDYEYRETPGIAKVVDALPAHWVRIFRLDHIVFYRWN